MTRVRTAEAKAELRELQQNLKRDSSIREEVDSQGGTGFLPAHSLNSAAAVQHLHEYFISVWTR